MPLRSWSVTPAAASRSTDVTTQRLIDRTERARSCERALSLFLHLLDPMSYVTLMRVTLLLASLTACSTILGIDEAVVVRDDRPLVISPTAPSVAPAPTTLDPAPKLPASSGDLDAGRPDDAGTTSGTTSCDGGRCVVDCVARPADCSNGAVCPAGHDCVVRCDETSCPSVKCAPGQACAVACLDGGCKNVELFGASASLLCVDCNGCGHNFKPGNAAFACRWDLPCTSTTICP